MSFFGVPTNLQIHLRLTFLQISCSSPLYALLGITLLLESFAFKSVNYSSRMSHLVFEGSVKSHIWPFLARSMPNGIFSDIQRLTAIRANDQLKNKRYQKKHYVIGNKCYESFVQKYSLQRHLQAVKYGVGY